MDCFPVRLSSDLMDLVWLVQALLKLPIIIPNGACLLTIVLSSLSSPIIQWDGGPIHAPPSISGTSHPQTPFSNFHALFWWGGGTKGREKGHGNLTDAPLQRSPVYSARANCCEVVLAPRSAFFRALAAACASSHTIRRATFITCCYVEAPT